MSYGFKIATGHLLDRFVPKPEGTDPRAIWERDHLSVGGDMGGSMKVALQTCLTKFDYQIKNDQVAFVF